MTDLKVPGLGLLRELEDATGKCRRPVGVTGRLAECDPVTGEVIRIVDTTQLPGGRIEVPCGNRREQVCPPCSRLYKGDTFQVMIAGLRGGHGIPEDVARHPAVFVTLTAPGFGLVHRGPGLDGQLVQCRPRRDRPVCEHGQPASCGRRHQDGEPGIGQPLCMECFDYQGSVLFNASVPALWDQAVQAVRRQLAADTGLSQRALRRHVRLSFGKVAEYQERGLVHVHAVFRLDGPDGPGDPAPPWASADLLRTAVLAAAQHPCRDAAPP
jgi:Replication initiator protein, pSAM2